LVAGIARALAAYSEKAAKVAERIDTMVERAGDVLGDLARALDGLLGKNGEQLHYASLGRLQRSVTTAEQPVQRPG
jgi:hypothetical protein